MYLNKTRDLNTVTCIFLGHVLNKVRDVFGDPYVNIQSLH